MVALLFSEAKSSTPRQIEKINLLAEDAHIGGDRGVRRQFVQQVRLHPDKGHDGVAAKPPPIHQQRRIVRSGRRPSASAPATNR